MSKAYDRTLKAWADEKRVSLGERVRFLIRAANWDLRFGPYHEDDPDLDAALEGEARLEWPGFTKATAEIRDALDDVRELWIDEDTDLWTETEPEDLEWVWRVGRTDLLRAIVGRELVEYVR